MSTDDQPFYLSRSENVGEAVAADDFLHAAPAVTEASLTETQYFGFGVPEHGIHGIGYLWHHPNLGTLTGGVWAFQGFKRTALACELFDMRAWMDDRPLRGDLHDVRLDNGYAVQVLEPLKRHRSGYADAARGNAFELEYTAVAPPVLYGNGKHFDQPMRVRGELTLRGRRYEVDAYTTRDRSWGKPRAETASSAPPVGWANGVFGDDFAFGCVAFDDARRMPEWHGRFALPESALCAGGWIRREGRVRRVVQCFKRTERDPATQFARRVEMTLVEENGVDVEMTGEAFAASEWQYMPNMRLALSAMRWTCGGRVAFGEMQEGQWNDFLHAFLG